MAKPTESKESAVELQLRLRAAFVYDRDTGEFLHAKDGVNKKAMTPAGSFNKSLGYITLRWDGGNVYAHRMAWVHEFGVYPEEIDHINGIRSDNRISNLRSVPHHGNLQNIANKPLQTNKLLGSSLCKQTGRYAASIQTRGKQMHLGRFKTPEDAHEAYLKAKRDLHTYSPEPRMATA